jgi:hypothetical protein
MDLWLGQRNTVNSSFARIRSSEPDLDCKGIPRWRTLLWSDVSRVKIHTRSQKLDLTVTCSFMAIGLTCVCFFLFSTFPGWHYEHDDFTGSDIDVRPFPAREIVVAIVQISGITTLLS